MFCNTLWKKYNDLAILKREEKIKIYDLVEAIKEYDSSIIENLSRDYSCEENVSIWYV